MGNTTASRQKLGQIKEIQPSAQMDNQNSFHFVYYKYHMYYLDISLSFRYIYHFRIVSPVSGMFIVYQTFGIYLDCMKDDQTKVGVKKPDPDIRTNAMG